jgi:hypothetical protein
MLTKEQQERVKTAIAAVEARVMDRDDLTQRFAETSASFTDQELDASFDGRSGPTTLREALRRLKGP